MMKKILFLICAATLISACGGKSGSNSSADAGQTAYAQIASRDWSMPSATEGFRCVAVPVTTDMEITSLRPGGLQGISGGMLTVEATAPQLGAFDCSAGTLGSRLLMAFGKGTGEIALPSGTAFHVSAGEFLLLTLHVSNSSASSATGTTYIDLRQATPAVPITQHAQAFMVGTFTINVPADGASHVATGTCSALQSRTVFAVTPLMRSLGTHLRLNVSSGTNNTNITPLDKAFTFGQENVVSISPVVSLVPHDTLTTTCTYLRPIGSSGPTYVNFGDIDSAEECFGAVYSSVDSTSAAQPGIFDCAYGNPI